MGRRNPDVQYFIDRMRTLAMNIDQCPVGSPGERARLAAYCKGLDSLSAALTTLVGERGALDDVDGGSAQDSKGFVEPREFDDDYSRDHGMDSEYDHDMHVRPTRGPSTGIGFDLARPLNRKG